jgi:signal transduction histidine kinase
MDETRFLKGLYDGMRCGILSIDRDGRLVVLNDLAARILELDETPPPGTPMVQALDGQPRLVRLLLDAFTARHLPNRAELMLERGADPGKTVGYTLSLIRGDGDEPAGLAMFFKDLTQIEQKEEQERLRDRLAALGQMAASMAHEIRNPLAAIEVNCSLLRRRLAEGDGSRELLDKVTSEVRRLNRIITDSLEFVRPLSPNLVETAVLPLLEDAIEVALGRRGSASIAIETDVSSDLPAIPMDRTQLRQVFENLLLNAFEAVGQSGRVRVEARMVERSDLHADCDRVERWLSVRVADSGPGVSDDTADKIFNPFFTTKEHGSGVGLSNAKKIVDSHHGLIDVKNGEHGGAVFTVLLPLHHERPEVSGR